MSKKPAKETPPPIVSFACPSCYGRVSVTLGPTPAIVQDWCICESPYADQEERKIALAKYHNGATDG